jgi:hypothetical protein
MRMTRRRFIGASAGLAAGLGLSPVLTVPRVAQATGWVTSAPPIPGLGFLTTLAADPFTPGTLLLGGDVHGLKRTTDAGQLWGQIDRGTWKGGRYGFSAIVPHPKTPGTYYALSGSDNSHGAVYVTTDTGVHWQLLHRGIVTEPQTGSINGQPVLRVYGRTLALDASGSSDVLYAASYRDGLYKSTDGGVSWSQDTSLAGINLTAVVLDPTNPSTLYLGWRALTQNWSDTAGGVKVSTDAGASWKDLSIPTSIPVRDLVVDPNEPATLYVAGLTTGVWRRRNGVWSAPNVGLPMTTPKGDPTYFNALEVDPTTAGRVLLGTGEGNTGSTFGRVYRSIDHAGSWTNLVTADNVNVDSTVLVPRFYYLNGEGSAVAAVRVVPPLPSQPNQSVPVIWVTGRSLAWYSLDAGASWNASSAGLEGAGIHHDVAVDPTPNGSLFMGTGDWALIRSDAARQTFVLHDLPGGDVRARSFAFTTTRLLLGTGSKDDMPDNVGGVFESAAGDGTQWTQVGGTTLPSARVVGLATAPSNPDVVYAALNGTGMFKSKDGGQTFAAMSAIGLPTTGTLFPGSFAKTPIAVHPTMPNVVYVLDHAHGLFVYSPSAVAWTELSSSVPVAGTQIDGRTPYQGFALDPLQPSRMYVATPAGLFRSTDSGRTWSPVTMPNKTEGFGPVAIDPQSGTVFAATALPDEASALTDRPGIYVSGDGGVTWSGAYVDGRFAVNFDALAIEPGKSSTVWAASAGSLFMLTSG